jgi:hypothetical protein
MTKIIKFAYIHGIKCPVGAGSSERHDSARTSGGGGENKIRKECFWIGGSNKFTVVVFNLRRAKFFPPLAERKI